MSMLSQLGPKLLATETVEDPATRHNLDILDRKFRELRQQFRYRNFQVSQVSGGTVWQPSAADQLIPELKTPALTTKGNPILGFLTPAASPTPPTANATAYLSFSAAPAGDFSALLNIYRNDQVAFSLNPLIATGAGFSGIFQALGIAPLFFDPQPAGVYNYQVAIHILAAGANAFFSNLQLVVVEL